MGHLKNIPKSSNIKISSQIPQEIQAKKNKLWPVFLDAKNAGKTVKWDQDKLIIDGKVNTAPKDEKRNINQDSSEIALSLQQDIKHAPATTVQKNTFQGHSVPISSVDDVIPALKALASDVTVAGSSHMIYAYRVGNASFSVHNWEDDGEFSGGRTIMGCIEDKEVYNRLICVTRWFTGNNVMTSKTKLDTIRNMVFAAIGEGE
jgi:hypothetical protein